MAATKKTTTTKKTTKTTSAKKAEPKMVDASTLAFDDLKRMFFRESPKNVEGEFSWTNGYYWQWALKKILSRFELENAPESWDINYFWTHLFLDGYVSIIDTSLGVIPLKCGYTGINVWDHPTDIVIANHVLGSFTRKIGIDGALIHLQYDYAGINPILQRFSTLLAMCDSAISVNLMNSKVAFIGFVDDQAQAATMKEMYDRISAGEPAVFVRKNQIAAENFMFANVRQSFIADDVMLLRRKIVNDFLSDIGINNANLDKRERLNEQEVNANNEEVRFNVLNWLDTIQEGLDVANRLYSLGLKVKLREVTTGGEKDQLDLMESVDKNEFTESN